MDVNKYTRKTLYIVGNGFDLYHNLPTSYSDFKRWLSQNGYEDFANHLEEHFNSNHELWTDFEAALGNCKLAQSYKKLADKCDVDTQDAETLLISIRESVNQEFVTLIGPQLQELMKKWIASINDIISKRNYEANLPNKPPYFSKNGVFISFNYTNTLEELYGVKGTNVKHLHGSLDKKKELIIGHNTPYKAEKNMAMPLGESNSKDAMSKALNDLKKRHKENWKKLRLDKRNTYSKVVVYGHSLSDIDYSYFEEISSIAPKVKWYISYHNDSDRDKAEKLISQLQLDENNVFLFYFGESIGTITKSLYIEQKEQLKRYCDIYDKGFKYVALPMSTCINRLLKAYLDGILPTTLIFENRRLYSLLNKENKYIKENDWYNAVIVNDKYETHPFSRAQVLSIMQETDTGVSLESMSLLHIKFIQTHFKEELLFDAIRHMAEETLLTLDKTPINW